MDCLFRYGDICLVRSGSGYLFRLMKNGKIMGFKKSGVRRIYGKLITAIRWYLNGLFPPQLYIPIMFFVVLIQLYAII